MIFTDERRRRGAVLVTPAIQMTAAASGSNGITVADDDDIDFGTGDFFIHWEGSLPDWTPSAAVNYLYYHYADANNRIGLYVNSSGNLVFFAVIGGVRVCAETTATTISTSTASVSGIDGAIYEISCKFSRETASAAGSISYFVNGAQLGSSIVVSAASPTSFTIAGSAYVSGTNAVRVASNTIACILANFAPPDSEIFELCTSGIPASWKWGSQASAVSGSALNGTSTRAFSSFSGSSTGFVASNAYSATAKMAGWGLSVTGGYKYRVKFDYTISTDSGTISGFVALRASQSDNTLKSNSVTFATAVASGSGSAIAEITATETGSFFMAFLESVSGGAAGNLALTIANAEITRLGATMALLPNTIPTSSATTWSDTSGNTGGGTLPAAGATKVTIRK